MSLRKKRRCKKEERKARERKKKEREREKKKKREREKRKKERKRKTEKIDSFKSCLISTFFLTPPGQKNENIFPSSEIGFKFRYLFDQKPFIQISRFPL